MRTTSGRVIVIGAGVSGLTSALCLTREAIEVVVLAERFAPDIVSVVAGALWEWPPAVCGSHHDQRSLKRSKDWCMTSYRAFERLARHGAPGVLMRRSNFYFTHPIEEDPHDLSKMEELAGEVHGFVRDPRLGERNGVNPAYGVVDAYSHIAPMIDTDQYMRWLMDQVRSLGVRIERRRVDGRLEDAEAQLLDEFEADAIVCCAGLGTAALRGVDMYPLRGALVRVHNDGVRFPRMVESHCVSHDEGMDEQDIVFIVPRGEHMLVLGGLAEADQWGLDIDLSYPPIRAMHERCLAFMPSLARAVIDPVEPVRVGLRPFRRQNVCLEREAGTRIVYNYAHGGAGFSFSWGCAKEVVDLVLPLIRDVGVVAHG